jgi:DNA-binding PadR family transcriptional regulator
MHSPINWALLGLVIERASYGYELVQRFERTYGDKLRLSSHSHAYSALDVLEQRGLIEELPDPDASGSGRQPKVPCRATPKGLAAYHRWMRGQVAEDRRRHHVFLLQMTALSRDPDEALTILDDYEKSCLSDNTADTIPHDEPGGGGALGLQSRLVAEEKRLTAAARLEWARFARSEIKAFARANQAGSQGSASNPGEPRSHPGGRASDPPSDRSAQA